MTHESNNGPSVRGPVAHDWFRDWFDSPYYHQLYADRDEKEAADLIGRLLRFLKPPPGSTMIDLACGRGRHACILAAHGYDVTGIDLAPGAIAFAKQFENEHLHFFVHDMRCLFCTNCFDYAFNFFTSFGYFKSGHEHIKAIRALSAALKPNGVFVLDYLNVPYTEKHLVPRSQKIIGGITYSITRWSDSTHFYKHIRIDDERLKKTLGFTEKVAKFRDFDGLLAVGGLRIRRVFGNYRLDPYDEENSPRMLIVAQKD
jgi:SAM-dependent methyltransferase